MNTRRSWLVVGIAFATALLSLIVLLWTENHRLRQERDALRAAADGPDAREVEPVRPSVAPEELVRLKAAESELLRLRNEVSLLRRARSTTNQAVQVQPAGTASLPPTTANETNGAFETKLSTQIPPGYALTFGGWTTESGNRALGFLQPTVQTGSGTNAQVLIRATLMEVPADIWSTLGVADIKADPHLGSQNGLMSQQRAESLVTSLISRPNCQIINRPAIQTSDGVEATVFVGEVTASGQSKGQLLNCLPRLEPDGKTIHLTLGMKFGPQTP